MITGFDEPSNSSVNKVAVVQIDIDRHQKSKAFFYIVFVSILQPYTRSIMNEAEQDHIECRQSLSYN
jgi:hypothetical protein